MDGVQVVEEFHQQYPQKLAPLGSVLASPRADDGDTVTVYEMSDNNNGAGTNPGGSGVMERRRL